MFALLLPALGVSFSKGYHSFTVRHKRPLHIRLKTNLLIFALEKPPPPFVNLTVIDEKNQSVTIPIGTYTHLQLFKTTVFVSVPKGHSYDLNFWLVPPALCNAISYAVVADNTLAFDIRNENQRSDFCLFSQPGALWYSAAVEYKSHNSDAVVEFYRHPRAPSKVCKKKEKICKYRSMSPFFIRFGGMTESPFSADVLYSATRWSPMPFDCALTPVPYVIGLPPLQMPVGGIGFGDIKCMSTAKLAVKYLVILVVCAVIAGIVLNLLHQSGYINLRVFCGCSAENDHFNSLKENPYACEIETESEPAWK